LRGGGPSPVSKRRPFDDRSLKCYGLFHRLIGGISVILIVFGGRSILAGQMTPGQFFMYISFTMLVAMPLVEIGISGRRSPRPSPTRCIREIKAC